MASDLISREAVLNVVDNEWYKYKDKDGLFEIAACTLMKSLFDDVERIEAVDAEPVRHGEWIVADTPFARQRKCSLFGNCDNPKTAIKGHYCWYCGAKMDAKDINVPTSAEDGGNDDAST